MVPLCINVQVLLLSESETVRSSEQQARLSTLVQSFNDLRQTCEQQVWTGTSKNQTGIRTCSLCFVPLQW